MDVLNQIYQFVGNDNDFFKGGLLLAVFGFVMAQLRRLPYQLLRFIQIRLVHTLRVDSEEYKLFEAFGKLLNLPQTRVQTRTYRLVTSWDNEASENVLERHFNADYFRFFYKGFTYYVDFEENKPENGRLQSYFVYRISAYWRAKAAMDCLTEFLSQQVAEKRHDELEVYHRSEGGFQLHTVPKRPLDSLYYEPGLMEELLADVQGFLDSQGWYKRLSIPYRRGYLLYGEPGTGKTSLIKGIASLLDKPVYILNESAFGLNSILGDVFADIPAGSVVVIEDFDRLFMKSETTAKPSMSSLLNQLDGLEAKEGLIIFITANHREVFDAALERPGRIDRKFYIGYMTWAGANKMFSNFFGSQYLPQFEEVWLDGLYTPAQLQVYFSKYKHDPKLAIKNFAQLLEEIGEKPNLESMA